VTAIFWFDQMSRTNDTLSSSRNSIAALLDELLDERNVEVFAIENSASMTHFSFLRYQVAATFDKLTLERCHSASNCLSKKEQ